MKNHEPLQGVYAGVQHSPLRILVDHKAPIYLPLWHSSKPPLPVKVSIQSHTDPETNAKFYLQFYKIYYLFSDMGC